VVSAWMDSRTTDAERSPPVAERQIDTRGRSTRARESRLSRSCLWWLLVAPFVGFALAGRLFMLGADGAEWELWKSAVLGVVLMVPFAVGAYFGLRAVRKRFLGGWVGLVGNVVLAVITLAMPISEAGS
jgi:hypothetical protein